MGHLGFSSKRFPGRGEGKGEGLSLGEGRGAGGSEARGMGLACSRQNHAEGLPPEP